MSTYEETIVKLMNKGVPLGTLRSALETDNLLAVVELAAAYNATEEIMMLKRARESGDVPFSESKLKREEPDAPPIPEEHKRKREYVRHVFQKGIKKLIETPKIKENKCDSIPKASSYSLSDIIILAEKTNWKKRGEPTGERVKRLKELQRGVSPEILKQRQKEEEEHAKKIREEVDAEREATSAPTPKEMTQLELPLSNGTRRPRLIIAKKHKIKGKIPKGLAGYWKEHFKGRPKGSFSEAVKILKKHNIENPEALAAYLEHESTSPKKWPAEE